MLKLLSCMMLGLVTGQILQTPEPTAVTGSEWVKEVDTNYQEGKYKGVLDELNSYYLAGQKANNWQRLLDRENEKAKLFKTPEGRKKFEELTVLSKKISNDLIQLKTDKNRQLKKIAADYPNAPITDIIRDTLNQEISPSQIAAVERLEEMLSPLSQIPESPLLKQLRQIRFESDVKWQLLYEAYKQGDNKTNPNVPYLGKLNEGKMDEYRMVLNIDKFNQMKKAANESNERDLKDLISTVVTALPILSAQMYDDRAIDQEIKDPVSPADKDTAKIIQEYNKKRTDVLKKYGLIK